MKQDNVRDLILHVRTMAVGVCVDLESCPLHRANAGLSEREPAPVDVSQSTHRLFWAEGELISNGGDSFASGKRQQERALVRLQAASSNGANG